MKDEKKSVLITGASRGIGRAIAEAVSEAGYAVVVHYNKSRRSAEELAESLGAKSRPVEVLQFDTADRAECREKLTAYAESHGPLWGIVLNAGIAADAAFPGLTGEQWDSVLDANLGGFYNVLQPLIMPLCRKKRGRIIVLSSAAGLIGNRGQVNYSASKAGLIGAAKALSLELASRSITVNCIAPGIIETGMIETAALDKILPAIPLGRIGRPEEVAALAVFLLSEAAAYITRQVISVNGGLV
ncbi:MAG: 3-oxoacyl-ACP reductase FabG [Spirochaetaceae bacterium]|nr:3-oxoacyl-ACP reductase FabG [Spirochaetaceae bacterium]